MVNLWEEMQPERMSEFAVLLSQPEMFFSGFVTEEEDGNYVMQATPLTEILMDGPWNPDGN
jgi:hypothetical protein